MRIVRLSYLSAMRRRQIINRLQDLPLEEKLILLGAIATIVSCFLPWYGINSRVINEWWNAFSSIGSVAGGFLVASSSLLLILVLTPVFITGADISKRFPWGKHQISTFLAGQNAFVALLFIPVYSQYALATASNSGVRFGLYSALLSSLVTSVSALIALQRSRKQKAPVYEGDLQREHRPLEDEFADDISDQRSQNSQWEENADEELSPFVNDEEDQTLVGYQPVGYTHHDSQLQKQEQEPFNPQQ